MAPYLLAVDDVGGASAKARAGSFWSAWSLVSFVVGSLKKPPRTTTIPTTRQPTETRAARKTVQPAASVGLRLTPFHEDDGASRSHRAPVERVLPSALLVLGASGRRHLFSFSLVGGGGGRLLVES